jgi:hypothetical protein
LLALITATTACCRNRLASASAEPLGVSSTSATDTLRGTVTIVGSDPGTWLTVKVSGLDRSVTLTGSAAEPLRSVSGADVWMAGTRAGDRFHVSRFIVRRVNDLMVSDGVIRSHGARLVLELTGGGQSELPNPSRELFSLVGSRVWIAGGAAGQAPSYGVIGKAERSPR